MACRSGGENRQIAACKGIRDDLWFWIPVTRFQILVFGTWIPDSICYWDSGFLELHSGFQSPGFQISKAKISLIPESKFPYMERDRIFFSRVSLPYSDKLVSLKSNLSLLYYYRYSFI